MTGFAFTTHRLVLIALLPLVLVGCNFDPATDHVQSARQPDDVFRENVWWIPIPTTTAGEWRYVPEPATSVAGNVRDRKELTTDVLVNGKVWRCTKYANGSVNFSEPMDPPEVPPSGALVCIWIGVVIFGLAGGASFLGVTGVLTQAKASAAETRAKERELAAERERQSEVFERNLKDQQEAEERNAAATEALRAEREDFEQQKNTYMAAIRESKMERTPPTQEEWKTLSEAVRAHQFRGRGTAAGIVVDYYFDPKTSGAFVFMWSVTWDRPYTPTIVVCRDGTEIRRETGMFKGEFGSQLLKRNHRYKFTFTLIDGKRELPNPLLIELALPPFDAWKPEPPKPMTDEERRQKRETRRRELHRQAEQFISDPQKLKEKKAAIDREILEEFGEE